MGTLQDDLTTANESSPLGTMIDCPAVNSYMRRSQVGACCLISREVTAWCLAGMEANADAATSATASGLHPCCSTELPCSSFRVWARAASCVFFALQVWLAKLISITDELPPFCHLS